MRPAILYRRIGSGSDDALEISSACDAGFHVYTGRGFVEASWTTTAW